MSGEMHWKVTTILICAYGIVKEFRPATPFITPYLVSPIKNFTDVELYSEIYPFWTYSYLIALIPVFFLTDILRYKPIVLVEAICLCGTWSLLVWGKTVWEMQIMQIIFGISSAAEIAYFSYMYAVVDQRYYKRITSYIRSAALVGKFLSFGLAQFLISFNYGSYLLLNQISLGAVTIVLGIAALLPPIPSKMMVNKVQNKNVEDESDFHRISKNGESNVKNDEATSLERKALNTKPSTVNQSVNSYFHSIWHQLKIFLRSKIVLKWSIWWALTNCGIFQVMNYVQTLWATMQTNSDTYNGITECANTLIGALISFLVQYLNVNWIKRGEHILFASSALIALLLFIISQIRVVYFAYIIYVAVITIYHLLITAASANIAAQLDSASYGLIFGWNTFLALILQTILTFVVADKHGLSLPIRKQFVVYGCYFAVVALIFAVIMSAKFAKFVCGKNSVMLPISTDHPKTSATDF